MVAGYERVVEAGISNSDRANWVLVSGEKWVSKESWVYHGDSCHPVMHSRDRVIIFWG